jgi:hypothetical protein
VTADDLLLQIWKELKSPDKVRAMLLEAGFPNALLNRLNMMMLFKPLLSNEIHAVTEKLWQRKVQAFESENPSIDIVAAPGMLDRLSEVFFTAAEGGRSVRKTIDNNFTALITYALLRSNVDLESPKPLRILVDLDVNGPAKPYRTSAAPERSIVFKANLFKANKSVYEEKIDLTKSAPPLVLHNSKSALIAAFHEAGHAVVNDQEKTGMRFAYATIRGGQMGKIKYLGYARNEELENLSNVNINPDHERVVYRIANLWAGRKAQELAGYKVDAGWRNDLLKIRKLASDYFLDWGLDRDFIGIPLDDEEKPQAGPEATEIIEERMKGLIKEGEDLAEKILKERWRFVRAVVAEMITEGQINGERFDQIQSAVMGEETKARIAKANWTYEQYLYRANCAKELSAR